MTSRILLSYDGTPPSSRAFDFILRLPREQRSELAILAVIRPSAFAVDFGAQEVLESVTSKFPSRMDELQQRARLAGTTSTSLFRLGHPAEQIIQSALEWRPD